MIPKNIKAVHTNHWTVGSGTGRRSSMLELYKPEKGAKVLNINVWGVIVLDPHRTWYAVKLRANFPKLSMFNSEDENEYLIQTKEHYTTTRRVTLYLGNPDLPEDLWDSVYEEASPKFFSKLAEYTFQVYEVPQEFDLLEDVKGEVGYFNMAPGSSLWISVGRLLYDRGDLPMDRHGFTFFRGATSALCWGDRISIFGSALENE